MKKALILFITAGSFNFTYLLHKNIPIEIVNHHKYIDEQLNYYERKADEIGKNMETCPDSTFYETARNLC